MAIDGLSGLGTRKVYISLSQSLSDVKDLKDSPIETHLDGDLRCGIFVDTDILEVVTGRKSDRK